MEHNKTEEELKQEIVNNLNNLSPIGSLFGVIQYNTYNDLNSFITNLNREQSLYCLIESVKYAHSKGVFTLEESECVSKSIRSFRMD
jgi:hypothetical protein